MNEWKLKAVDLDVPKKEPFKNDLYNRKKSAETLTKLLGNSIDPLVICIDGRYGDGKTTYLKMWRAHLEIEGFPTVLFNAWENDFSDDPLVSLIGELDMQLKEYKSGEVADLEETLNGLKEIGIRLAKRSVPILVRAVARKAGIEEGLEELISITEEEVAAEALRKYEEGKKNMDAFKKQLESFAATLEDSKPPGQCKKRPLVVMIDELDRCRPPFAIGVLEKIKHLFSVPNVMFVLAVDKNRLNNAISVVYGPEVYGEGYLRRFFDFDFRLTSFSGESSHNAFLAGIPPLGDLKQPREVWQSFLAYELSKFMDGFELTLRERAVLQTRINFVLLASGMELRYLIEFIVILLILQMKSEKFFSSALTGSLDSKSLLEELARSAAGKDFLESAAGVRFEFAVHYFADKKLRDEHWDKAREFVDSNPLGASGKRRDDIHRAIHIFGNGYSRSGIDAKGFLREVREYIDVARSLEADSK